MRKTVIRSLLSNTIKDTSTIMRIHTYIFRKRVTHWQDCHSILDSIAKKTSCSHCFSHGASLHQPPFSIRFILSYKAILEDHIIFLQVNHDVAHLSKITYYFDLGRECCGKVCT